MRKKVKSPHSSLNSWLLLLVACLSLAFVLSKTLHVPSIGRQSSITAAQKGKNPHLKDPWILKGKTKGETISGQIVQVTLGKEAFNEIHKNDPFQEKPPVGTQWAIFTLKIKRLTKGQPLQGSQLLFYSKKSDGSILDQKLRTPALLAKESLNAQVIENKEKKLKVALLVPEEASNSQLQIALYGSKQVLSLDFQ
ncbi:hypothetical protein D3H64_05230 [Atopobacter sp. AH10]|uniref:hypothetical protein n=1 Tax=Atopobacter sp. AH10 TaxID=2315861 RepID=UPI000EF1AE37|nr:hypothetical protein [Atopobacter sp. AH10]RLK63188.1 hypothetical protein D3H64_05230 [Atopobacter sp. AH10]